MNNSTIAAAMRRVLRHAKRFMAFALIALALPASAANFSDLWWNKDESGWGLTLAHHNDKIFGVWFVYDTDGQPYWVSMSDGAVSGDGYTFSGALYRTTGPSYRGSFDRDRVKIAPVGTARLDFARDGTGLVLSYSIGDTTITKQLGRMPYGNAPANFPADHSDLWWNPAESGWGLALSHHGDTVFGVWYTYAEDGRPLWIILPAGRFTAANTITGKLYIPSGTPYNQPRFDQTQTRTNEVGSATLVMGKDEGEFTTTVNGYTQKKRIYRIGFGTPAAPNALPTVSLAVTGTALAPAKLTLKASAADSDGSIAKVEFYYSCVKIGESSSPPFQITVPDLPVGTYYFSARAIDNRNGSVLSAITAVEVKNTGSGTIPPAGNKAPTVSIATPANGAFFAQGAAVELTASAKDTDGTVKKVEYLVDGVKVGEAAAAPWSATWTAIAGDHQITALATDDKGAATTSATVAVAVAGPAVALDNPTKDAARFLTQATFGPKGAAEIDALKARGYPSWLDEQLATAAASHVQYVNDRKAAGEKAVEERSYEAIWQQWLFEPGQLRARMAFALSEIFVISNIAPDLDTYAMSSYMDMLNRNAFGNYRQLLEDVALHPAMGYYLNMIGSKKANPAKGTHPNENFAREVMQLFSIGLYRLNPDGSRQLDAQGQPIPTYDQAVVGGMAAAFSGWNFAGNDVTKPSAFDPAKENWLDPMAAWEAYHDTDAKTIVNGVTLPAGQNARADLKGALDALHNHPNVGPFIGRQLIQRFVTSNPSPAYVGRVAATFGNNGQGVRGDLRAVIRAVLLDPEARDLAKAAEPTWGKQREPVVRFANFLRAFNATSPTGRNRIWYLDSADEGLNQSPLLSPSVFNFFSPNYRQPGPLSAAGLVAPEFQITTETSMVGTLNFFGRLVKNGAYGSGDTKLTLNLAELTALAANPAALADRLNLLLLAGAMSDGLRANIIGTLGAIAPAKTSDRVKAALTLVAVSPDYAIQK